METLYYYKTIDDVFVFSDGTEKTGPEASLFIRRMQDKGTEVERLYTHLEQDWLRLKEAFRPEVWKGKTWWDLYVGQ